MGYAYSPKDAPGRSTAPAAARLHVTRADPFKLKAERDAARRAGRATDGAGPQPKAAKAAQAKLVGPPRAAAKGPTLRLIASNDLPGVRPARLAKAAPLTVVASSMASNMTASASDAPVVTDAVFTEAPKERISERAFRPFKGGGGGNDGGPPLDRIFNQDDLAGVLIVLALLFLMALYFFRGGTAPPQLPQKLASTASVAPTAPPAPLADPFGDKPVDLRPKSPPPPPAAQAAPAPAPVCPPGRMMRAWFCTAQSELTPASRASIDKDLADWGSCLTGKQLVVTGYADTRGGPDFNVALSSARASVVADLLRAKGVKVAAATGAGELSGLADNENCANQRRVDVRLSDDPEAPPSKSCAPPEEFIALSCG